VEWVSLGEGKPRERDRTPVILTGRGVQGGRGKLSTLVGRKTVILSFKLEKNSIVFTKSNKMYQILNMFFNTHE
jgi:hypothetical protein